MIFQSTPGGSSMLGSSSERPCPLGLGGDQDLVGPAGPQGRHLCSTPQGPNSSSSTWMLTEASNSTGPAGILLVLRGENCWSSLSRFPDISSSLGTSWLSVFGRTTNWTAEGSENSDFASSQADLTALQSVLCCWFLRSDAFWSLPTRPGGNCAV